MTPTNRLRQEFEAWAGKRESAPTTSAWDYAFKAWQEAALAERERCAKMCDALVYAIDSGGNQYRREANAIQCAAAIRASNL
jgi:hypothetical protein